MLPSDLDGKPPPSGAPNVFMQFDDSPDQLQLGSSVRTGSTRPIRRLRRCPRLGVVASIRTCGVRSAVAFLEPGTTAKLGAISDRLMYRLHTGTSVPMDRGS